ncbi:MAG: amidase [Chloroflexota bacterium]
MDGLIYRSAKALAEAIRTKEVSSYEVVTACISLIEAVNPKINAVVQNRFEEAVDEARQADDALRQGESWGSLHGVPMTIKDSLDTAGVVTTVGTKGRQSFIPTRDATAVARPRAAGAILVGKTNTSELTAAGITDNHIYGQTNNPYDLNRTPGGSSGGAAAIVATGAIPFDIGSDSSGSVRLPAHYCGVAGLKPTMGRVSRTGHIPSFDIGLLDPITQIGPLARHVEDLPLLLRIISGVDWIDPTIVPVPLGNPEDVNLSQLRVAYYSDNGIETPTSDTEQVIKEAIEVLSAGGMKLVEDRPPIVQNPDLLSGKLVLADGGDAIRKILQTVGTAIDETHPSISWTQSGEVVPTLELTALIAQWNIFRSQMLTFMKEYDAIVCPASSTPAPPHEAADTDFSYTSPYNLTGWPAVVVRGGTSSEGLPIGVQIIARPWHEDVACAIAQQIENELGGWQLPSI